MNWLMMAAQSLLNRKTTAVLTLFMLALSVCLVLTVDRVRIDTKDSFSNTLSGTDLIVGARTGGLNLLLYSVFRIGNATNNFSWDSFQELTSRKEVKWTIPISLGDSHKGFRVIGTNEQYFEHYQYGRKQSLQIKQGQVFDTVYEVVLGSFVAKQLGYKIGDKIIVSHGMGSTSFKDHDDKPFTVVGVLAATGTPVDKSLHIPLEGMTAIHLNWRAGAEIPGLEISAKESLKYDLTPKTITAALVGMKSRIQAFQFQRAVNDYSKEPMMAIIPGAALAELWQMIGIAEKALIAISIMVVVTGMIGMITVILAGLNERRREMAILRAVGCSSSGVILLLMIESAFYGFCGLIAGYILHLGLISVANLWVQPLYGINLTLALPEQQMVFVLMGFLLLSCLLGIIPGFKAYKQSLSDGLTVRT